MHEIMFALGDLPKIIFKVHFVAGPTLKICIITGIWYLVCICIAIRVPGYPYPGTGTWYEFNLVQL